MVDFGRNYISYLILNSACNQMEIHEFSKILGNNPLFDSIFVIVGRNLKFVSLCDDRCLQDLVFLLKLISGKVDCLEI